MPAIKEGRVRGDPGRSSEGEGGGVWVKAGGGKQQETKTWVVAVSTRLPFSHQFPQYCSNNLVVWKEQALSLTTWLIHEVSHLHTLHNSLKMSRPDLLVFFRSLLEDTILFKTLQPQNFGLSLVYVVLRYSWIWVLYKKRIKICFQQQRLWTLDSMGYWVNVARKETQWMIISSWGFNG